MNKEKSIETLNTLIQINNDRIEGYDTAYEETNELDLKALFTNLADTSDKCKAELIAEVNKLGGSPIEGTKITGKFFRVWMDVKAALINNNRKTILNSCEQGEDIALKTYADVLKNKYEYITAKQQQMLTAQINLLKADHDTVKRLRDALQVELN